MAELGSWAILLALIVSVYAVAAFALGARWAFRPLVESARNGIYIAAISSTFASFALVYLLATRDFGVRYVYEHTSSYLSPIYTLSAFWAGQEGSLLLWLWLMALLSAWMAWRKESPEKPSTPLVLVGLALVQAFLALVLWTASNPFETLQIAPGEGHGLNPLLQNIGMILHPPVIFAGYTLYAIPFALSLAALIGGELTREWARMVRRWALLAWLLLGVGILLGAWWAYLELGWGGYWGWDPVENASLIPWLTGTALLHSLMMQGRRGAFKVWNLILIAATFLLCILATFITRSGLIRSVHAFGRSPIGFYFGAFILLMAGAWAALLYWRRALWANSSHISALLSRETGLLLTNLLFVGTALVILLGTLFPTLTETLQGRQASLGAAFYARTAVPLFAMIVLFIGVCPWLAWGGGAPGKLWRALWPSLAAAATTAVTLFAWGVEQPFALLAFAICAFDIVSIVATLYRHMAARRADEGIRQVFLRLASRNRRRYGAYLAHLGIVCIALGVIGSSAYQSEVQVALTPGEMVTHAGYTLQYQDLVHKSAPGKERYIALLSVRRGEREIATLRPEKSFHSDVEQWVSEVDTRSTLREDLYVSLAGVNQDRLATFQVLVNPLVAWIWIGGALLLAGSLLAWWPAEGQPS